MRTFLCQIKRIMLVVVLSAATILVGASPIHSQFTIVAFVTNLNDDGDGSLRKAIVDTNNSPGVDQISITVNGQLNLASALPLITEAVTINGPGAAFIIDGQNFYQGFLIANVPVAINDLTVQHAVAFGNVPGAGIVSEGDLTLNNVNVLNSSSGGLGGGVSTSGSIVVNGGIFEGNASSRGGGLYAGGTLSLTDAQVINNNAQVFGGGAYAVGTVQIRDSTFMSNSAASYGGGLAINEAAVLTNVRFQNNRSVQESGGGLILFDYVPVTFTHVDFVNNSAKEFGGGIAAVGPGGPASAPDLLFNGGRFERNLAEQGPGAALRANNVVLTNTLFISNSALFGGGGANVLRFVAVGGSFEQNHGGGLVAATMDISGTQFTGNIGGSGGAAVQNGGKATNVLFANNRSGTGGMSGVGGGLSVSGPTTLSNAQFINNTGTAGGGLHATGDVTVTLAQFIGNNAPQGGGVWHGAGSGTFINSLFAGNSASGSGAAMHLRGSGTDTIQHVTIASSTFVTTSAIATTKDVVLLQNDILANHASGLSVTTGFVTLSNNLFHNNGVDITGTVALDDDHFTGDPLFTNPAANNFHLQVGSPATDTGRDLGITGDFDGDLRPFSTGFDIGYDEVTELPESTSTPTSTSSLTPTLTPMQTPTPTVTNTPDNVPIPSNTPTPTGTVTQAPTPTPIAGTGATQPLRLPSLHH